MMAFLLFKIILATKLNSLLPNIKYFSTFIKNSNNMGPQSPEGLQTLLILASICVVILVTAFSLTFFRKADTSDKKH